MTANVALPFYSNDLEELSLNYIWSKNAMYFLLSYNIFLQKTEVKMQDLRFSVAR